MDPAEAGQIVKRPPAADESIPQLEVLLLCFKANQKSADLCVKAAQRTGRAKLNVCLRELRFQHSFQLHGDVLSQTMRDPHLAAGPAQCFHLTENAPKTGGLSPAFSQQFQSPLSAGLSTEPKAKQTNGLRSQPADPPIAGEIFDRG